MYRLEEHGIEDYSIEELESMIAESELSKQCQQGVDLFRGDKIEKDEKKGYELIRDAAIKGWIPAMYYMTTFCHNDRGNLPTQDRQQECFWYDQILSQIDAREILYHAQNMAEGSYDRRFSTEKINESLAIAAALGNNQAKGMLAGFYAKKGDTVSLKKALYWFYSMEKLSPREEKRLKEVEQTLGL